MIGAPDALLWFSDGLKKRLRSVLLESTRVQLEVQEYCWKYKSTAVKLKSWKVQENCWKCTAGKHIEVDCIPMSGIAAAWANTRTPGGNVSTQGWMLGSDEGADGPAFLDEFPIARALRIA